MATITHKVIEHTAHLVPAAKLLVGDVVATKGNVDAPQRLRRVDIVEADGKDVNVIVSTPRTGAQVEAISCKATTKVCVVGRTEELAARPKTAAKPKTQRASAKNPASVKTTKVDAVLQTTPPEAKPEPRQTPTRQTSTDTSIRSQIRTAIREAVGAVILDEVKAAIAEALA